MRAAATLVVAAAFVPGFLRGVVLSFVLDRVTALRKVVVLSGVAALNGVTALRRAVVLGGVVALGGVVVLGGLAGVALAPSPALAAPACAGPGQPAVQLPWSQRQLGPDRAWPLSTGAGVTVAVLDSGVDAGHPQLRGHVQPGADFLTGHGHGRADTDCVGHGTAVASIIAGQTASGTSFHGIAPGARILPVRVSELTDGSGRTATIADFAAAIRWAADHGAGVINLSVAVYTDDPRLRAAVRYAQSRDVLLVAAAGNEHDQHDPVPYPAGYDGVLGVGAVDAEGARYTDSQVGTYVDLVAPGVDVTAAAPGSGHLSYSGTSFATPFVSAAAALVRAYRPDLPANEVARRLVATADPTRGAPDSREYGAGLVDPYRAVTEPLVAPSAGRGTAAVDPAPSRGGQAGVVEPLAIGLAVTGAALAASLLIGAAVLPRGRRRHWRPGRPAPARHEQDELPAPVPATIGAGREPAHR